MPYNDLVNAERKIYKYYDATQNKWVTVTFVTRADSIVETSTVKLFTASDKQKLDATPTKPVSTTIGNVPSWDTNGNLANGYVVISSSSGTTDAGKIVETNSLGKVDGSFLPGDVAKVSGTINNGHIAIWSDNVTLTDGYDTTSTGGSGNTGKVVLTDINGKISESLIPDSILGQLIYGGTVFKEIESGTAYIRAQLSAAAKTKLGATADKVTLVSSASSSVLNTFGYQQCQKIYFVVSDQAGFEFADLSFKVGDWLLATNSKWDRVANTDAVTSVNAHLGDVRTLIDYGASTYFNKGDMTIYEGVIYLCLVDNTIGSDIYDSTKFKTFGKVYQSTGSNTDAPMSQKATTDAITDAANTRLKWIGAKTVSDFVAGIYYVNEVIRYSDGKSYVCIKFLNGGTSDEAPDGVNGSEYWAPLNPSVIYYEPEDDEDEPSGIFIAGDIWLEPVSNESE